MKKLGELWRKLDLPLTMTRVTAVACFAWSITMSLAERYFLALLIASVGVVFSYLGAKEALEAELLEAEDRKSSSKR